MTDRPTVNIEHGRTEEQRNIMRRIAEDGVDPFDWDHITTYHQKPILLRGQYWVVTENDTPYEGSTLHLLLIYRHRILSFAEMEINAWGELHDVIEWALEVYEVKYGALVMRFGDITLSGASVDHPHMHIIVGGDSPETEKLKVSVGYKQK